MGAAATDHGVQSPYTVSLSLAEAEGIFARALRGAATAEDARRFTGHLLTAGLYHTAGFNDDTRAFVSIPARHEIWRRASTNWLAGLVVRALIELTEAREMATDMAIGPAKRAYRL